MEIIDTTRQKPLGGLQQLFLLLVLSYTYYNLAWVTEDAFITFRSVDQLLAGHGPVWNLGERVQVYTHPLWYGLLVLGTGLGAESYYFVLGLSYGLLLLLLVGLLWLVRREALNGYLALLLLLLLSLSRAFMDYSSSGLENPLLHVLVLAYVLIYCHGIDPGKRFFRCTLILGLAFLTRPDAVVLLAPAQLALLGERWRSGQAWLKPAGWALLPVLLWEVFSLFYYGSPIPNTALAKVNLGYEPITLLNNAYYYFRASFRFDPLTLVVILLAVVAGILSAERRLRLLALGLLLQLVYITKVGGDYMLGRFLSAAFLLAVIILLKTLATARFHLRWRPLATALVGWARRHPSTALLFYPLALLAGGLLLFFLYQFHWPSNYLNSSEPQERLFLERDFMDERGYYINSLGLRYNHVHHRDYRDNSLRDQLAQFQQPQKLLLCNIGISVWSSPQQHYVIDPLALSEPFLARLPARDGARVGHYERAFPPGYLLSRMENRNRLQSPVLARLYDDVLLATQGELWSWARLGALWRLNSGHYKNLADEFDRNAIGLEELGYPPARNITLKSCMGLTGPSPALPLAPYGAP